jgi:plastocyanin
MRRFSIAALAALAIVAVFFAGGGAAGPAAAAGNTNVHVHDNYFHPQGAFLVGLSTDHVAAQAACQAANPAPACDTVITAGDTVTWIVASPPATHAHSVTECTDNTFSICGPAVSATNPINDAGVRLPSGFPYGPIAFTQPGTYYFHCDIHPATMRGRVVVQSGQVGGTVDLVAGGSSGGGYLSWIAMAAFAAIVAAAGARFAWARRRRNS